MQAILFDGLAYGMLLFLIGVGLSIPMGLMNSGRFSRPFDKPLRS